MAGVSSPRLVGRAQELAALEAALERAAAGTAGVALVAGDSGVGKSRLVAELVQRADRAGMRTLAGECVELSEGEIPFAPVVSALRRLARDMEPDEFAAILGPARDEMTRLFPVLAVAHEQPSESPLLGSIAQSRLFELLLGVLERLGRDMPVLLVIEDLHWADRSTRDLLLFLARSVRHEQVLIVVTYRSDELHRRHPLRPFLAQAERMETVERIELEPLTREQVADQLEQIVGERPSADVVAAFYDRAEGNPFFTEELLAASASGMSLPATLRDTLLLRVEDLSPSAQQVLRVAAAAGRRAQHGLLAAAAELNEDELLDGLREAVGHHVLIEAADDASYEFRHALMREAVYDDLLPGERGKLHRALACAIEAEPSFASEASSVAAELAFHWYAAHELGPALRASIDAGLAAERMYAFAEAARHFDRALELWDRAAEAADGDITHGKLLEWAADASHHAGDTARAVALIRSHLAALDQADVTAVSRGLERLGRYLWIEGHGGEALEVYHQAVEVLPATATPERARALAGEALVLMLMDRPVESKARSAEALEMARAVGERRVEANVLNTLIGCDTFTGEWTLALEHTDEARSIAQELGQAEEVMRSYVNGGDSLDQAGRVEEALAVALEGAEAARDLGLERLQGHFLTAEASMRLMALGRWDEAERLSQSVIDATDLPLPLVIAREARAYISAERGDFAGARRLLDHSRVTVERQGGSMWLPVAAYPLALLDIYEGRLEDARDLIADTLAQLDGEYVFFTRGLYMLGARVEADIAERARPLRDTARIEEADERLLQLQARLDALLGDYHVAAPPPGVIAARTQMDAERSRLRAEPDPETWLRAAAEFDAAQQYYAIPYARFRAAEAEVRLNGRSERAAETLAAARQDAAGLGMAPLLGEIDALARRARLKLAETGEHEPVAAVEDLASGLGLTDREMEVLALVADGRTNRQIGTELFMSEKTASVHVSRILSKLGAANRAEAAASAQRLGLVG